MKKKVFSLGLIAVLSLSSMLLMTGCGDKAPYEGYDLSEYVTVGEYKGLEYEKTEVKVSESEIQAEIDSRLEAAAETVSVEEGTVEDGDTINVAFEGKIDGETFEGGSSDSYDITIGTTTMIDGFVEGLIGKEVGETVVLDLQFPEDYGKEELNGKDVEFTVTINSKQVEEVPEYDLDFIKANSDYDNFDDYEASVKADLKAEKESEAESELKSTLWEQIVTASEIIQYPSEKDELIESTMNSFKQTAEDNDMEWDTYLEQIGYSEEDLTTQITSYAETKVFQEMIVYSIAEAEGLEVTDDEYTEYMDAMLTQSGLDAETFESYYGMSIEDYCEQEGLRSSLLLNKVMDKVMEYAKEV